MKLIMFICASLFVLFVPMSAIACLMSEKERVALFHQYDDNKDGKISLEEYVTHELQRIYADVPADQVPAKKEILERRYSEQMDYENKGAIALDQFDPIHRQKCL